MNFLVLQSLFYQVFTFICNTFCIVSNSEFGKFQDKIYYLIKWFGWSSWYNTWEPEENLNCCDLLKEYQILTVKGRNRKRDCPSLETPSLDMKQHVMEELYQKLLQSNILDKISLKDLVMCSDPQKKTFKSSRSTQLQPLRVKKISKRQTKTEIQKALKAWELKLNKLSISHDPAPIFVENKVDLEGPPENFIFINERQAGAGVTIDNDPLIGCDCLDCHAERKSCCAVTSGCEPPYYKTNKRLRLDRGIPIYECNSRCKCGPDCLNRVVQNGRKVKICIFRTATKGWGVKTLQPIKKGTFVIEYVGEVSELILRGLSFTFRSNIISLLFTLLQSLSTSTECFTKSRI